MSRGPDAPEAPAGGNLVSALLLAAACGLAVLAVFYGPTALSRCLPEASLSRARPGAIAAVRWLLLAWAAASALAALAVFRIPALARAMRSPRAATGVLSALFLVLPLGVLELALGPFTHYHPTTGLFLRDSELGWRLRPSAVEVWGGQQIETNALGLRGPARSPEKPEGVRRILFLGDSVTFGYRVAYRSAYPSISESLLREAGHPAEAINAGVGGYSPWQYDRYLRRSGIDLEPDVVVVGFVLNDVTEKFRLVQFGGTRVGVQLAQSIGSIQDHLARYSNLFHHLRRLLREWRFGSDPGALEELDVRMLVDRPDDPDIATAWRITLENLDRLFDFSEEAGIPALLVVFPYAFQLDDPPGLRAPQRILQDYARQRSLAFVDASVAIEAAMADRDLPPAAFFIDPDHLSGTGHRVVAEAVVAAIAARGWLAASATSTD